MCSLLQRLSAICSTQLCNKSVLSESELIKTDSWVWWCMSLIPAIKRQGQADLLEFEANLSYKASSRIAIATQETLCVCLCVCARVWFSNTFMI